MVARRIFRIAQFPSNNMPKIQARLASTDRLESNGVWPIRKLPAPVHPDPLLRISQEHSLQSCVVGARVAADGFIRILAFNQRQWFFEADNMRAVRFAPTRRRNHPRTGLECENSKAVRGAGGVTEEVYRNTVRGAGVLVENVNDNAPAAEYFENG